MAAQSWSSRGGLIVLLSWFLVAIIKVEAERGASSSKGDMYSRVVPRLHAGVRAEEMLRATTAIAEPRSGKHLSSLLVLHGLGDSADGFGDVVSILGSMFPDTKFVVPSAPAQPVTVNGGMVMPSWYDISSFDDRTTQECAGLLQSIESVRHLVEEECASVGDDKVAIMGFSQGGVGSSQGGARAVSPRYYGCRR
ncbi:uncharacterized protein MONBRDRAFT_34134 [Monosiga brevicollis MX1]|uniref:Phospholipase/carboxylesterase/thioesterase domain-containing protein n=1 Tax=Monosiga brevicollis TaxID=81824 RepID=A9V9S3_MONBE|nr:uncharacterized protein MONBRDRAFT_34134 [Monosiga brevicollis MX1]EDQ85717.1 predicted protein [Monosiga brevicollis MX1]|eukprot:XP_001749432.1 hypothetical protein [Monosiga brevicollis MX1]